MVRTKGARNLNNDARRSEMIDRMRERLGQRGAVRASWRELAAAADVSLATLNHHFGKRDDVIRAILHANGAAGAGPLAVLATPGEDFAASINAAVAHLAMGFQVGVGDMVAIGLIEGLRQPTLGEVFVEESLEPIIAAMAQRLAKHQAMGQMVVTDTRIAALQLVAPILLADLHQQQLGGEAAHPLDMAEVSASVAGAFVRAYGSGPLTEKPTQ